jgi:ABC-type transport system involved in multi-copper enzyme maturation permease subunit
MKINPVLSKEIKIKMRSWKIVWLLIAYLAVLALVAVFFITMMQRELYGQMDPSMSITIYVSIAVIQFFLIVFIAPSLTSGSISGERERQTLDLLLSTKMAPRSIILGKLFSSINQIILLIVASFPIFSIVFLFGGISTVEVIKLFLFYIVVAITMGSIGIFFSTFLKKTTAANVLTYGFVLFLIFGTLFINVFVTSIIMRGKNFTGVFPLSYVNPLTGFASLLSEQFGGNGMGGIGLPGFFMPLPRTSVPRSGGANALPLWQINILVNMGLSIILLFFSSLKINPIKKKVLKRKKK